jgi:hypothetical protein
MVNQSAFFASWATEEDALPLVLTGPAATIDAAADQLRSSFTAADIYHLVPQGRTVPIKDIRAMRAVAGQKAWSGRRLVIISEAEKLSTAAAEALLKILEESTRSTRFVLTTQWYRRLLPTIRSRCLHVRLAQTNPPASAAEAALPSSVLARFAMFSGDAPLTADTLDLITTSLEEQLRQQGPTPALKTAYMRLRDYHRLAAEPSGNHKLARDVLLASLPPSV